MTVQKAPHRALRDAKTMAALKMPGDLRQGDVRALLNKGEDRFAVRFNAMRAFVTALWPWASAACLTPMTDPFDRRRNRNAKTFRRWALWLQTHSLAAGTGWLAHWHQAREAHLAA